jgi:hypothetical protein
MAIFVIALRPGGLCAWAEAQQRDATKPNDGGGRRTAAFACQSPVPRAIRVRGTAANGTSGPDLTHIGCRRTIAAGLFETTRGSLAAWIADPQTLKPGNNMPMVPLNSVELRSYLRLHGEPEMTRDDAAEVVDNLATRELTARLSRIWDGPRGCGAALSTVDHKIIGRRYIVTAFVFLA